jgi:choline dehydrogenase-like flavoprotein
MYNLTYVPQVGLNGRAGPVAAGAIVGGGSAVNGMFFDRGSAADYDAWEQLGNPGWGWKDLLPYFKKSVTFTPPAPEVSRRELSFGVKLKKYRLQPSSVIRGTWTARTVGLDRFKSRFRASSSRH